METANAAASWAVNVASAVSTTRWYCSCSRVRAHSVHPDSERGTRARHRRCAGRRVIDAWLHSLHDVPAVRVMAACGGSQCRSWEHHPGVRVGVPGTPGPARRAGAAVRHRRQATPGARATAATRTGRTTGAGPPRTRTSWSGGPGAGLIRDRAGPGGATGRASAHGRPTCWRICTALSESAAHHAQRHAHRSLPSRIAAMSSTVIPRWRQCLHRQSDRRVHRHRWAEDGIDPRTPVTEVGAAVVVDHVPGRWNDSRCDVTVVAAPSNCVRG